MKAPNKYNVSISVSTSYGKKSVSKSARACLSTRKGERLNSECARGEGRTVTAAVRVALRRLSSRVS